MTPAFFITVNNLPASRGAAHDYYCVFKEKRQLAFNVSSVFTHRRIHGETTLLMKEEIDH